MICAPFSGKLDSDSCAEYIKRNSPSAYQQRHGVISQQFDGCVTQLSMLLRLVFINEVSVMSEPKGLFAERNAGRKGTPTRKRKKEQGSSTRQAEEEVATHPMHGECNVPSRLESAISELQGLHELLLSGDLDPRVLANFRDALNRVRTAAWAAQQYVTRREIDQDSSSVLSFLVGERIRAAYNLCQGVNDDLKRTDIKFQAGSLVQLHEVTEALTEQLHGMINKLG
jgi:hypothetical protein